jgi:hypothetical protein
MVYDDAYYSPFKGYWDNKAQDSSVLPPHGGSYSIRRSNGETGNGCIIETETGGFVYGSNTILDFWANHHSTVAGSVGIDSLRITMKDNTSHQMGTRGPGVTWVVDGVDYTDQTVLLDNDPSTWQHVQFDISQTYYHWDNTAGGDVPDNVPSDEPIHRIEVRGGSTVWSPYLDDIQFTPEPTTIGLLVAASVPVLLRRRRSGH